MKRFTHCLLILLLSTSLAFSQSYLGVFEEGETVPLLLLSADPQTHAPTDPADLSYTILKEAEDIASGTMSILQLGVAVGSHSTVGNATGPYHVLYAGLIQGTTIHKFQTYSLVEQGKGVESIAAHVMGLNGSTPMTVSDYIP
ncbi:hypothetical protein GF373_07320, partial [bacterium]|nr:hypothetical protein [bacterium]